MEDRITENTIEKFAIEFLEKQGCQYIYAPYIAPDSDADGVRMGSGPMPLT